jgi:hypothetical protein
VTVDRHKTEKIIDNIKTYLSQKKKKKIDVEVMTVEVQNGNAEYADRDIKTGISLHGFGGEIIIGKVQKIKGTVQQISVKRDGCRSFHFLLLQLKTGPQINKLRGKSFDSNWAQENMLKADCPLRPALPLVKQSRNFHLCSGGGNLRQMEI